MKKISYIFIVYLFLINKSFALIEVDITRGNLDPLPIAVSPLHVDIKSENSELEVVVIYSILISIMTDIGGLIIGKIFKGKKLTKISSKKTISGSIGSFASSLILIPFFIEYFLDYKIIELFLITILISLISQMGDLFISLLKRRAKVKDTSDILPGHGGILDRVDGIIFSIPLGLILFNLI